MPEPDHSPEPTDVAQSADAARAAETGTSRSVLTVWFRDDKRQVKIVLPVGFISALVVILGALDLFT